MIWKAVPMSRPHSAIVRAWLSVTPAYLTPTSQAVLNMAPVLPRMMRKYRSSSGWPPSKRKKPCSISPRHMACVMAEISKAASSVGSRSERSKVRA